MKKSIKMYSFIVLLTMTISNVSAVPRFGVAGQGTPVWGEKGLVKCNPGWHWCMTSLELSANRENLKNLITFEASENGEIKITLPLDFAKRFPKMMGKSSITLSENVPLDEKLSELIEKDLGVSIEGNIVIKKGNYNLIREGNILSFSIKKWNYVGHVTLLK